ncbi:SRPBCC family protein [Arthrobacter sp. ISL-72]|uniref:SRPBCC family protein n=1 Tax=Arthrobacter sp. ISL-72 TaxID=2819114 RepID=UPI002036183C|nr:SRPBCC family protein [Arthrobacter sp. ISL-72]
MTDHEPRNAAAEAAVAVETAGITETAGRAFAAMFRALKLARPDRPIHPEGVGLEGELTRTGEHGRPSGIDWLDAPGVDPVKARFSRSVGLPQTLPDILGLALRITTSDGGTAGAASGEGTSDGGTADVLFASTGWKVPGRFLLMPKLDVAGAALTTLMPYRGRKGPVLLGLRTVSLPSGSLGSGEWVLGLYWASPAGPWRQCGELRLSAAPEPSDIRMRFNPLENQPPGARTYAWTRRLRERSYRAAQRPAPAAVVRSTAANQARSATTGRDSMSTVSKTFLTPPADVWKVIADGWLYSGWVVGASRIRDVDALWPATDAVLHHSVGAWPLLINDKTLVTASDPGKSIELIARGWPLGEAKVVITLEPDGAGCKVTIAEDAIKGPGVMIPKFIRDPLISVRNKETLNRLELMASGGAGQ